MVTYTEPHFSTMKIFVLHTLLPQELNVQIHSLAYDLLENTH